MGSCQVRRKRNVTAQVPEEYAEEVSPDLGDAWSEKTYEAAGAMAGAEIISDAAS